MENRREFMKTVAMAAAVTSAPRNVLGANDRVRMAVIGTGSRGTMVNGFFRTHADCEFVAACDVRKTRLDQAVKTIGGSVQGYGDYRRVLERKDIDALLVTTPDHWHGPIVAQACAAGKDCYVEKPMTHTIEDAVMAVEAAKKYKRIVQLGVQQRSGAHFLECVKMIQDGYIGKVSHCVLNQPGSYGGVMQPTSPVPDDLDWEMFQGSAPRKPFSQSYLRWRAFYMYGGGLMTDWGVHLTDIALLAMKADGKAPIHTSASAQYVGLPEGSRAVPGRLHRRLAVRRFRDDVHQHPAAEHGFPDQRQLLLRHQGRAAREPLPATGSCRSHRGAPCRCRPPALQALGLGPPGLQALGLGLLALRRPGLRLPRRRRRPSRARCSSRKSSTRTTRTRRRMRGTSWTASSRARARPPISREPRFTFHAFLPARTAVRQGRQIVRLGRQEGRSGLEGTEPAAGAGGVRLLAFGWSN